jgi:hypothetical protein
MSKDTKLKLLAPNAKGEPLRAPEEILVDLFWARFWKGDSARLLMFYPDGDMTTILDDTDLSPWQEKCEQVGAFMVSEPAALPPENWKPPADSVAFLKDMMNKGSIPVGVIVPDYDPHHQLWPPCYVSGYLPDDEAKRILFAFVLGYKRRMSQGLHRQATLKAATGSPFRRR